MRQPTACILVFLIFSFSPLHCQQINKDLLLGKIQYTSKNGFVEVGPPYASKKIILNQEVYQAFLSMFKAARQDGIDLRIISGGRSFDHQKEIWERKWQRHKDLAPIERTEEILKYSSMPGTSRHHWGTEIDLNNLENTYFSSGQGKLEYEWLTAHAGHYGFYQVYTSKSTGRTGYNEEKWHWSYLPLATTYLEAYNKSVTYEDIAGFSGAKMARVKKMIPSYVNGISRKYRGFRLLSEREISSTKLQ